MRRNSGRAAVVENTCFKEEDIVERTSSHESTNYLLMMATLFRIAARRSLPVFTASRRGYADKMSFTFASPYEVFRSGLEPVLVDESPATGFLQQC